MPELGGNITSVMNLYMGVMNYLLKFVLVALCLVFFVTAKAQTHEVGVHGGWLTGYNAGRENTSTMTGGWTAGGYYRYTVNKWFGVESGLDYTRKKLEIGHDLWENSLSVPVNVVVFPKFRFSLFGGLYMKNRLGTTILSGGTSSATGKESTWELKKKPAWGYEAGVKWNMKYFRFVVYCKQDMISWVKDNDQIRKWYAWTRFPHTIKSFSIKLTAEIPLWQSRKI